MESNEVVEDYKSSLSDLAINSKPLINMLTMLADENKEHAEDLVKVIEAHILKVSASKKLPCLYLIDSIIKNIHNGPYLKLFMPNIVNVFCAVFEKVDEKTRQSMFKLRQTWSALFPKTKLYALDVRVNQIDPAWPIQAKPIPEKPSIHVNPKFIKKEDGSIAAAAPAPSIISAKSSVGDEKTKESLAATALLKSEEEMTQPILRQKAENAQDEDETLLRAQLLEKQKELLQLQQKQMDLELEAAKKRLAEQASQRTTEQQQQPAPVIPQQAVVTPPVSVVTPVSATPRDPRLVKARDPRLKNIENDNSRSSSPAPLPVNTPAVKIEQNDNQNHKPAPSSKSTSKSSSSNKATPKKSSKLDKKDDKSKSSPNKKSSSSTSKSSDKDKRERRSSSRSSKPDSKSSSRSHRRSTRSKSPEKHEDKDKDDRRIKERRNYRSHRTVSPDGDSNDSEKRRRLNEEDSPPPIQRHFAIRSRQVQGPGRSIRAKRAYPETRSIEEHERLAAKLAEEKKHVDTEKAAGDNGDNTPLEDQDERRKHLIADADGEPPHKKAKETSAELSDDLLGLFGTQDVDYRQMSRPIAKLPPIPKLSPNSRPSVSASMSSPVPAAPTTPQSGEGWARFKADRPEEFPFAQPRQVVPESPSSATPSGGRPFMLHDANQLLEQADAQLQEGLISAAAHHDIITQLAELYRLQQQKQQVQQEAAMESKHEEEFHTRYPPRQQPSVKRPLLPSPSRKPGPLLPDPPMLQRVPSGPPRSHPPSLLNMRLTAPTPNPTRLPLLPPPPLPPISLNPRDPRKQKVALLETPKPEPVPIPLPPQPDEMEQDFVDPNNLGYDTKRFYVPQHDPRWMMKVRAMHCTPGSRRMSGGSGSYSDYEVIFNGRTWSVPINGKCRFVKLPQKGGERVKVLVDLKRRELYLDDKCLYYLGQPKRVVSIRGMELEIGFQGAKRRLWIDGHQFDVREDAPPENVYIDGKQHELGINGLTKRLIIDGHDICPCDPTKPQCAMIAFKEHEFLFAPPRREMLIDGLLCTLEFAGAFPAVNMKGKLYGICFDGPPRDIIINGQPWSIAMDQPRKIYIGQRPYHIGFGGPGYEVIIDDEWHELKFGGEERVITVGSKKVALQLPGPPPEVKILGQLTMEDQLEDAIERAAVEDEVKLKLEDNSQDEVVDSTAPAMPAQPVDKENMPATVTPSGLQFQNRRGRFHRGRPWLPRDQFLRLKRQGYRHPPGGLDEVPPEGSMAAPAAAPGPAPAPAAPLDIDSVLSKLLAAGILKKPVQPDTSALAKEADQQGSATTSPVPKVKEAEPIPDLTDFGANLKGKYEGIVSALYAGIQCTSCGQRFQSRQKDKYQQHLDWHFRQNTRSTEHKVANFRRSYPELQDWTNFAELADLEGHGKSQSNFFERMMQSVNVNQAAAAGPEGIVSCPAASTDDGDADDACAMCHETFEQFFEEEDESWHLKDAIRVNNQIYHPVCYEDYKEQSVLETPTPDAQEETPDPITNPLGYLHALNKKNKAATPEENTPAPEKDTLAAEKDIPAPENVTPVPENVTPAPENVTPAPENDTPAPENDTPAPENITLAPEIVTPAPENVTPAPENVTLAPENAILAPENVTPAPEIVTLAPENVTLAPEIVTLAPENITPTLENDTPTPENITPTLENDTPTPENITPTLENDTPTPENNTPAPEKYTRAPESNSPAPENDILENQEPQDNIADKEPQIIIIKPENVEEELPGESTPFSSPTPPRDRGIGRVLKEHDVLMSPAETLSDIDDDAIIRAQFTDVEEEEGRETPMMDEDEELLNSSAPPVISPTKIQITVSRKIPPALSPATSSRSPSPVTLSVTKLKMKHEPEEAHEEEEDGSATPLHDEEPGTPTMDEAPVDADDPPTPLADEPPHDIPEESKEEVDPWSLIPMDSGDEGDDDIAPFVPPADTTPVKDEPPPPGEEELKPLQSTGSVPAPVVGNVPAPAVGTVPAQAAVAPQVMMMPQYQYPTQPVVAPGMVYTPQATAAFPYNQGTGYYMPPQQQQSMPASNEDNAIQTLSTVTGHRPRDPYRPSPYHRQDNYYNNNNHERPHHGGSSSSRRYRDDNDDRRSHRHRNSRERERDGDRDRRRGEDRGRRW